jgi:adenylate cyclase
MTARILVVDDEPDVEALVTQKFRRQVRKGEMDFVFAHDGQHALELLENGANVDMVLSDINMPRMDGLTLLDKLGELHAEVKTVIVSAYGDMGNIRTAMNRGAFDFVTKPIEFEDLETTIAKTLAHLVLFRKLEADKARTEQVHATLSRYFSPNVAETLEQDPDCLTPGGERREATFLFTDLADFTPLVESSNSEVIVELLNAYRPRRLRILGVVARSRGTEGRPSIQRQTSSNQTDTKSASKWAMSGYGTTRTLRRLCRGMAQNGPSRLAW